MNLRARFNRPRERERKRERKGERERASRNFKRDKALFIATLVRIEHHLLTTLFPLRARSVSRLLIVITT